jgi:hypothetical protein
MMSEIEPVLQSVLGERDPLLVRALRSHAVVESWRYRRRVASELNDHALAILEQSGSAEEIDVITCMQTRANLLRLRGLSGRRGRVLRPRHRARGPHDARRQLHPVAAPSLPGPAPNLARTQCPG